MNSGTKYAVKQMRSDDEEKIIAAKNEFKLMKSLTHPHIVEVIDIVTIPGTVYIVMELVDGMELFEAICENEKYCENDAKLIFRQILDAIGYMHRMNVCHRDIKPSNILIEKQKNVVKVTDFNISKMLSS